MVESMSSCRINYITYHLGIFIYQGGMEEVEMMMWIRKSGEGKSIEEDFKTFCSRKEALKIISLLRNISWGVKRISLLHNRH